MAPCPENQLFSDMRCHGVTKHTLRLKAKCGRKENISQPCIHTMQALYKIIQNNTFSLTEHGEVTGFLSACEAGSELDEGGTTWEKQTKKTTTLSFHAVAEIL